MINRVLALFFFSAILLSSCSEKKTVNPVDNGTTKLNITSITPASGIIGDVITITGTGFDSTRGTSIVTFFGAIASEYISWSPTSIVLKVPAGAETGKLSITLNGQKSNEVNFTVTLPITHVVDLATDTTVFTYYNLRENKVVPVSDSNKATWDIAFKRTAVICNSGVRGPGIGAIQAIKTDFLALTEAPADGYKAETTLTPYALPSGSGNGWYNYNPDTHALTPIPGVVICMKTADGKYVKLVIKSYYKGSPSEIKPDTPDKTYTFDYVYQPDGTRKF